MIDLPVFSYQLDFDECSSVLVTLELCHGRNGVVRWAIREMGACLNKKGKWEDEPMPSSRTDAFYRRCRWSSAEDALAFWRDKKIKSRFRGKP